jgi:hypothetical protein
MKKNTQRKSSLLERTTSAFGPLHQHKRCKMQMVTNLAVRSEPRVSKKYEFQ